MRLAMDKAGWRWGARFDQPGALVDVQLQMLVLEAVVLGGEANPTRALGEVLEKVEKIAGSDADALSADFKSLEGSFEAVAQWRKGQLVPLMEKLEGMKGAHTKRTGEAESSERLLADLDEGRNSYEEGKSQEKVSSADFKRTSSYDPKPTKTLQQVYDAALADSPDPARINEAQTSPVKLLEKKHGKEKAAKLPNNDKSKAALNALEKELAELVEALRKEHDDAERDEIRAAAELTGFVDRVMELVEAEYKKLKPDKLTSLRKQLTEGIVDIVLSNPELDGEAAGPLFTEDEQAKTKALIEKAKGDARVSKLLFDVLDAGAHWAFGALHYVWKVNRNYEARTGGVDMFSFYAQQIVPYDFFKQQEIEVNKVAIPALQQAEQNFVSATKVAGVDPNLEIESQTKAFKFRSDRDKAMGRNLNDPVAKLSEHDLGLGLDVNYDGKDRNPHVQEDPEIWEIVRMVLKKFAPELADVNPSANLLSVGADAAGPEFENILHASKVSRDSYPDWCADFPREVLRYEDKVKALPSADEYKTKLKSEKRYDEEAIADVEALPKQRKQGEGNFAKLRLELLEQHKSTQAQMSARVIPLLDVLETEGFAKYPVEWMEEPSAFIKQSNTIRGALTSWSEAHEVAQQETEGGAADGSMRDLDLAATRVFEQIEEFENALRQFDFMLTVNDWSSTSDASGGEGNPFDVLHGLEKGLADARCVDSKSKDTLARANVELEKSKTRYAEQRSEFEGLDKRDSELVETRTLLEHLRILGLNDKYRVKFYEPWSSADSGVGFADFNPAFVLAMDKAGWRWGARFDQPDFQHFEYKA